MSESASFQDRVPVGPGDIRIEDVGVRALDQRRVDVAVDLTPCLQPVDIDIVIVGPDDEELCCMLLIDNREWALDKIAHLRQDAQLGEHILHVGVFYEDKLVTRAARSFSFSVEDLSTADG